MWNCGSAKIALLILVGTGLSTSAAPELWLGLAALSGICSCLALSGRRQHKISSGATGDIFLVLFLVTGMALYSCLRIEAQARKYEIIHERVACLRGTVAGFAQPSEYGTSFMMSTLEPDFACASLPSETRVLVRIMGRGLRVSPGDTVSTAGLLRSPHRERCPGGFSEAAYLFQTGAKAVLTVPGFLRPVVRRAYPPKGFVPAYVTPVHDWIEGAINQYVGDAERPFLLALVLGERGELADEMKEEFRQSGIIHLISVSGLHTALVAMIAFVFLKGIRLPVRAALIGSTLIVWFYCGISGCSPPTLRSSLMVTCVVGSRLLGRTGGLASPLCASCAVLLIIDPRYLTDVGFELSYAATGSMVAGRSLGRIVRHFLSLPEWFSKYVLSTVLTTVVAQLGVLPILALQFGSVSAVSIPANLFAIPVASGALVSSFCSLGFVCLLPWLASCSFSLTWLLLRLCSLIAKYASSLPGASIELMKPTVWEALIFMVCLFLVLTKLDSGFPPSESCRAPTRASIDRKSKLVLVMAGLGMVVCILRLAGVELPWKRPPPISTEVDFLDVGQGDATAIKLPDGRLILVDGGECVEKWDSAKRVLIPYLREARRKVFDIVFVTHFHSDHVNGVMKLAEERRVRSLVLSNADTTSSLSRILRCVARKEGVAMDFLAAPCTVVRGEGVRLTVLHPSGFNTADTSFSSINDSSMVLVLETGPAQFVLTGDTAPEVMDRIADLISPEKITVLKTPHHGGKGTLSVRFLEKIRPKYVLFSVGRNNRFGHPAKDVVRAYEKAGATIFRTDADGSVSFRIAGDSLRVATASPASGLALLQKVKCRRGARKIVFFALFSGNVGHFVGLNLSLSFS